MGRIVDLDGVYWIRIWPSLKLLIKSAIMVQIDECPFQIEISNVEHFLFR